jgi:hypothetical protein
MSADNGINWKEYNKGLLNTTIRRFAILNDSLFVGTNEGLFVLNQKTKEWVPKFTNGPLQVNGMATLGDEMFIGTNQGIYKSEKPFNNWKMILPEKSVHNIAVEKNQIFAMLYNELFVSTDHGNSWKNDQNGMPAHKYAFQVKQKNDKFFAAQWDGVYYRNNTGNWKLFEQGLPKKFAVTELVVYKDKLVAAGSNWSNENKIP